MDVAHRKAKFMPLVECFKAKIHHFSNIVTAWPLAKMPTNQDLVTMTTTIPM